MSNKSIPILENSISFTPFYFYNVFLKEVAQHYKENSTPIKLTLIKGSEDESSIQEYYFDPIAIPLLLSLCQQLSFFHHKPIDLILYNNYSVSKVLEFLFRADFFYISGNNLNPNYPLGKHIFSYDERYLGNFGEIKQRIDHKVRCYSITNDNLKNIIEANISDENKRDYLIEFYTYKVKEHFYDLLFDNHSTLVLQNTFIEILSELITNGVLHSGTDTFALMFADRYKTKFSISDNGIGFYKSLEKKEENQYYKKFHLFNNLMSKNKLSAPESIKNNLFSIFEALYYSMTKSRKGLFDLMCTVVLDCSGYFRLHMENCQIIISNRMFEELSQLNILRLEILELYNKELYQMIDKSEFEEALVQLSLKAEKYFIFFVNNIIDKYNDDYRYSSIRFYNVKFKGVHIEVEIPNIR